MHRYKITIEYDGTHYVGWQHQPGFKSIQGQIEKAIVSFCQQETYVYGSGRTDAGVHALAQVAHFDLEPKNQGDPFDPYRLTRALNYYLHDDPIRILDCTVVDPEFHARFSALKRSYVYKVISRAVPLALEKNRAWYVYKSLDLEAMQEGAAHLIGYHDFSAFRASACQSKSPIKTLDAIDIQHQVDPVSGDLFLFHVEAPSFLHHQVRNIVGTLKMVGEGLLKPEDVKTILASKDRRKAGPTAAASGLYFKKVWYPQ